MIEPLTIGEIKELVSSRDHLRLILAWAHERARGNKHGFEHRPMCPPRSHLFNTKEQQEHHGKCKWDRTSADWLNEVLDEIGWPQDQRG